MIYIKELAGLISDLALGGGFALIYDVLRYPRHRLRRMAWAFDALFCLIAGYTLFCVQMKFLGGRPELWTVCSVISGFMLWEACLTEKTAAPIAAFWTGVGRGVKKIRKIIKKSRKMLKILYAKAHNCFIIYSKKTRSTERPE